MSDGAGEALRGVVLHLYATGLHPELFPTLRTARLEGVGWRARAALLPGGGHLVEVGSAAPPRGAVRGLRREGASARTIVLEAILDPRGPELPEPGRLDRRELSREPRGDLDDQAGPLRLRVAWSLERLDPDALAEARERLVSTPPPPEVQRLVHDGGHRENEMPGRFTRLDLTGGAQGVDALATLVDPPTGALVVVQVEARWG